VALPDLLLHRQQVGELILQKTTNIDCDFTLMHPDTITVERRLQHQATGTVIDSDAAAINDVTQTGKVPIIGFGGFTKQENFLFAPSLSVASQVSSDINAQKLIILRKAGGIFVKNHKGKRHQLSFADAEDLLSLLRRTDHQGNNMVTGSMLSLVHIAIRSVCRGTPQVHIVSESKLMDEILTKTGFGTLVEHHHSHHVEVANTSDISDIKDLHLEGAGYTTTHGTPLVKPQYSTFFHTTLDRTFLLKHNNVLVGKLHGVPIKEATMRSVMVNGFIIAEGHQNSQQGRVLFEEALDRFKGFGYEKVYAVSASPAAKKLFTYFNGNACNVPEAWQQQYLQQCRQRYHVKEQNNVILFEIPLF
jgi:hypothetical protein